MRRRIRTVLWSIPVASGLVLGCEEQLKPTDVAGAYSLRTVEYRPVPYLILATLECDISVVSGSLTLTTAGTHELLIDTPADCTRGGGPVTMAGRTYPGTYELGRGHGITFRSPVQNGPDLVYTGAITADQATVTVPDLGSGLTPALTLGLTKQ
jgi:hypothetical protein